MDDRILSLSHRMFTRSDMVRRARKPRNEANWLAYRGEQDWSHKADFQSRETTPGFPMAIEQIVGVFERALTDSEDWVDAQPVSIGKAPFLDADTTRQLLMYFLTRLWLPGNRPETSHGIQVVIADAVKVGLMEPAIVAKIWPVITKKRHFRLKKVEPTADAGDFDANQLVGEELESVDVDTVRLAIEIVPWDDYFPDPSPACQYEIHRTRKHLSELLANPEYDQDKVKSLMGRANAEMDRRDPRKSAGERAQGPDPFDIEVFEGWGNVIDDKTGEVLHENVFWTWAGDCVLREPTANPCWDGTRPFIVAPILRMPGSKEPKALADLAVPMWRATNELVNLLIDGSMRAAWGVGQVRPDIMESPEEISGGMPQGYVAVLKPNVPINSRFYERVDESVAPQFSLEGLNRLENYIGEALATPDTKLGQIPDKAVKATEIVQAMQASGSLFESLAARLEDTLLEPLFEKAWRYIIQYVESFVEDELVQILGARRALMLEEMSAAKRFRLLHKTTFKVRGLRGLNAQERKFAKLMTVVSLLQSNQQFADHFGQTRDFNKFWDQLLRSAGVDPTTLEMDEEAPEETEPTGVPELDNPAPPEAGSAGGQLDPTLAAGNGGSQPNLANVPSPEGAQGGLSSMAATTNPNTGTTGLG